MSTPLNYTDFYKTDHRRQYPKGTELIYSNFTARKSLNGLTHHVVFGIQYLVREFLWNRFNNEFFDVPKEEAVAKYKRRLDFALGPDSVPMEHIYKLHDLGYLPIHVKALNEGSLCKIGVPCLTIYNNHKEFFWLPNFLETLISAVLWGPMTSATIAYEYKKTLKKFAVQTSDNIDFVEWQCHDFSMRGMMGIEAAAVSGAAHLLSFKGTDSIPAIDFLEKYYDANCEKELIGGSVPATEHSVMCAGGKETERETFLRLITQVYPSGIVSIVSDTWDFWKILNEILPSIKNEIMRRTGKVVIRLDSGDPYKILVGDNDAPLGSNERKGAVEVLWEIFGGEINSKGYKELDSHIGLIYGEAITLDRCAMICEGLELWGFSSTNIVFGLGSYSYQYVTRDTLGFAMKSTYAEINGESFNIFKGPKTCYGFKKSAKGLLNVNSEGELEQERTWEEISSGLLQTVFKKDKNNFKSTGKRFPFFTSMENMRTHKTLSKMRERLDSYD